MGEPESISEPNRTQDNVSIRHRESELVEAIRRSIASKPNKNSTIDDDINFLRLAIKEVEDEGVFTNTDNSLDVKMDLLETKLNALVEAYAETRLKKTYRGSITDWRRLKHMVGEVPVKECHCEEICRPLERRAAEGGGQGVEGL